MAIFRVSKNKDFTAMSNYHLRDKTLSLKAKGLLCQMLSMPDDWNYSMHGLAAITKENEGAIKSALDELREHGYIKITKKMPDETKSGRIEYVYDVYERPQGDPELEKREVIKPTIQKQPPKKQALEKQALENQGVEKQALENPALLNTNIPNTKILNTKYKNIYNNNIYNNNIYNNKDAANCAKLIDDFCGTCAEDIREQLRDLLNEWLKVRKTKRAANTPRAIAINLNKLKTLASQSEMTITEYLEEIISRGWAAFFEIKNYSKPRVEDRPLGNFDTDDFFQLALNRSYKTGSVSENETKNNTQATVTTGTG